MNEKISQIKTFVNASDDEINNWILEHNNTKDVVSINNVYSPITKDTTTAVVYKINLV